MNEHLDDELDDHLSQEARGTGGTRPSSPQEAVRAFLGHRSPEGDAWDHFTGAVTDAGALDVADDDVIHR